MIAIRKFILRLKMYWNGYDLLPKRAQLRKDLKMLEDLREYLKDHEESKQRGEKQ